MTAPHPLPAEGGSYIRNADGSLTPLDEAAPPKPPAAKPAKPAVKEE
ncbi:hypothetical protein [Gemmobacter caeni]|uniref:Uncharacterized protein n=1 Tax=Gemmobacter caeni TaxID=589035 RepID=A0A2T6A043_9RHOB|nr:hypothetical protein [Gemmobacter caeni]PTX37162.1 hypothetical protein C8N34_1537 [Gemmobacter caeni]